METRLNQPFHERRGVQCTCGRRTAGLTGNGDTIRVSAEGGNVVFDPLARLAHIEQRIVAGASVALFGQFGCAKNPKKPRR